MIWRSPLLLFPILWALAGALFGAGFAATLSIGWGLILLGVILAGVAAWQSQGRGLWAALIGFGLAPAAILILDVLTAPPPCSGQPVSVAGGGFNCGYTPLSYTYMAIGFGVIALIGALIPLAPRITRALRSGNAHPNDAI